MPAFRGTTPYSLENKVRQKADFLFFERVLSGVKQKIKLLNLEGSVKIKN